MIRPMLRPTFKVILLAGILIVGLTGCKKDEGQGGWGDAPAPEAPYVVAAKKVIAVEDDYPGRVVAVREAQVRPQVSGIVRSRIFTEGDLVEKGDALYQIDPDVFAANAAASRAAVSKAEAAQKLAKQEYDRAKELREGGIASSSEFDAASANYQLATADLASAKAQHRLNSLNLSYAEVKAPLSGRISISKVTEGALVSPSDPEPMTIIQQIDEVYVDVKEPLKRYEELQAMLASGMLVPEDVVEIPILSMSGAAYPIKGEYLFTDTAVDATTSEVTIRVKVDNPEMALRPGMFVRATIPQGSLQDMVTAPQQAVKHDATIGAYVYVIDSDDKVQRRQVSYGRIVDGEYVITKGIDDGDRVMVEGHDSVRPGVEVSPRAWDSPDEVPNSDSDALEEPADITPSDVKESAPPSDAPQDEAKSDETAKAVDAAQSH